MQIAEFGGRSYHPLASLTIFGLSRAGNFPGNLFHLLDHPLVSSC